MSDNNTVRFDDIDVSVNVNLAEDIAIRETGFDTNIEDLDLINPNEGISSSEILAEGVAGNLYYNFHTSDFGGGEVRGQLELLEDRRDTHGVGEVVFVSDLNG